MNVFSKIGDFLGETFKEEPPPPKKKRRSSARKKAATNKVSTVIEKSFLRRTFGKPEVTTNTYTDSEWIYAAIEKISTTTGKIPVKLFREERNGNKVEVTDHPALRVLNRPNPDQTENDLRVFTQMNLDLFGTGYWYLARGEFTGTPKEIWPLKSSEVQARTDSDGNLIGYHISRFGKGITLTTKELIAFRQVSPNSIYEGESAAKACARSVRADSNTLKYVEAFFDNSARPDFILSVMGISAEGATKLENRWKNRYGGTDKAHKPAVIDGQVKLEKLTAALKDLDITEQSRERRDRILGAFGVPKAILGLVDDVNRASMEGSKLAFAEFTVDPRLQEYVEKLNAFYLPMFAGTQGMFFAAEEHIPRDREHQLREIESGLGSGWMTINEARAIKGFDPVENGDTILVPFSKIPIDQAVNPAEPEAAPPKQLKAAEKDLSIAESEEEYLKVHNRNEKKFAAMVEELFEKQRKDVISNLTKNYKKDPLNPVDEAKWLREFIETSVPLYLTMVEDGGELGAASVASMAGRDTSFNVRIPAVVNEVSRMATKFATQVNETTKESLRRSLMEGVAMGEGEPKLADRVDDVFKTRKNNAGTIARTETTRSINFGQVEGYRQNGVGKKQWLTVLDESTREGHAAANLQSRGLDEPFVIAGEKLKVPGDPSGSPGNTINCRCRVLPVI